jgi:hypothetical protein
VWQPIGEDLMAGGPKSKDLGTAKKSTHNSAAPEEEVRLQTQIPRSMLKRLKQLALERDITLTELVTTTLANLLKGSK